MQIEVSSIEMCFIARNKYISSEKTTHLGRF